jgi:hypothetical protein
MSAAWQGPGVVGTVFELAYAALAQAFPCRTTKSVSLRAFTAARARACSLRLRALSA